MADPGQVAEWPPYDVLPGSDGFVADLRLGVIVARFRAFRAMPEGALFSLELWSAPHGPSLQGALFTDGPSPFGLELQLTASYDGRTVPAHAPNPADGVLQMLGGSGGDHHLRTQWWLSPLPVAGNVRLSLVSSSEVTSGAIDIEAAWLQELSHLSGPAFG